MRLILLLLLGLAIAGCDRQKADGQQGEVAAVPGVPQKGVSYASKGKSAPDTVFRGPEGEDTSLADFRGAPVLVNLWATWCAPCVKELPTLDRLAAAHNEEGTLEVVAISQDMAPQGSVVAFLDRVNVNQLGPYQDPKMALSAGLGVDVLPTSILYNSQGKEVWRYVGDLDWTGAEATKLLAEAAPAGKS